MHKVKPAAEAHAGDETGEEPFTFQQHWVGARDYVSSDEEEEEEAAPLEANGSDRAENAQARESNEPNTEVMLAARELCNHVARQQ